MVGFCLFVFLFVFCCYAATQLALQVQQERTQVVCSNREAWKRPLRLGFLLKTESGYLRVCCYNGDIQKSHSSFFF